MKAIVFDLDGTLIHSVPDMHTAVSRLLVEEGAVPLDEATVQGFVGNGLAKLVERVVDAAGLDPLRLDEMTGRTLAHYNAVNGQKTALYPGVADCLDAFANARRAMGICTNKPEAPARHILGLMGIEAHFSTVVGGDTLPIRKPDPRLLLHTIALMEADPSETLYVGDSEVDADTAAAAGVPFALYTEGYRKQPVEAFDCRLKFDRFEQLARHVLTA